MIPIVPEQIEAYAEAHTTAPPAHLAALAEETRATLMAPQMMVGPLEGRYLELLVYMKQPQRVLEIGTYSGYSSLSMAAGLPPGGHITTLDISEKHAEVARRHIASSPFADRITVIVGAALDSLTTLDGPFDFVFIDADKTNYANYLDAVLPKLAEGGVIAVDNTLWSGQVVKTEDDSADTVALRAFNDRVVNDPNLVCVQTTVRDGVTLIRKI